MIDKVGVDVKVICRKVNCYDKSFPIVISIVISEEIINVIFFIAVIVIITFT